MGEDDLRFVSLVGISVAGSAVQAVANTLDELAPDDVEVRVLDDLVRLPRCGETRRADGVPDAIAAWVSRVVEADAVVLVGPGAPGPLPRVLTDAVNWLENSPLRPMVGKAAAVITVSAGPSSGFEQDDRLRNTLAMLGAVMLAEPRVHVSNVDAKVDIDSACLRDVEARLLIGTQLAGLAVLARAHRRQRFASG